MLGSAAAMNRESADRYAVARRALSRIPHGVAIIGAADGAELSCATGTAMYVSFVPPLLAIAEHPGSRTAKLIVRSGAFSVSLLARGQQRIAELAGVSGSGPDKFAALGIETETAPHGQGAQGGQGAPGVAGAIAILWCAVRDTLTTGDHLLFIGEVIADRVALDGADALLRYRRRYSAIGEPTSGEAPEGYPT